MFKTFIAELKYIFKDKWRIAGFILLLFIPLTYGFLYMNAYWAPFSHVDRLKVGVVSQDKTTSAKDWDKKVISSLDEGTFTAGQNQIYDVVKSTINPTTAREAVESGKYSGMIIIPDGYNAQMDKIEAEIKRLPTNPTLTQLKAVKHEYDLLPKATFYFSYKNSYLGGEMMNFFSKNTQMVLKTLFPYIDQGTSSSSKIIDFFKDMIYKGASNFVTINRVGHDTINSYGSGLAPYFISIALWAGALATLFVVKNERHVATEGTIKHMFGKLMVWIMIGWIQATMLISALWIQGIDLGDRQWQLYLFAYFMATAFPTIVMFSAYTMRFGDIGEFIVVIMLVAQLISSSGTFPVEMQNIIFKIIHPIAPFTYTIAGLREIMWAPDTSIIFENLGYLLLFPIVIAPISIFLNWWFDKKNVKEIDGIKHYKSFEIHMGDY